MKSRDGKSQRREEKRMFVQIALATLTYAVAVRPSSLTMLFMSLSFLPVVLLVVGASGRGGSRSVGVSVAINSFFLSLFLCSFFLLLLRLLLCCCVAVLLFCCCFVVVLLLFCCCCGWCCCSSLLFVVVVVGCYYWWWYCCSSFDFDYLFGFFRFFSTYWT